MHIFDIIKITSKRSLHRIFSGHVWIVRKSPIKKRNIMVFRKKGYSSIIAPINFLMFRNLFILDFGLKILYRFFYFEYKKKAQ